MRRTPPVSSRCEPQPADADRAGSQRLLVLPACGLVLMHAQRHGLVKMFVRVCDMQIRRRRLESCFARRGVAACGTVQLPRPTHTRSPSTQAGGHRAKQVSISMVPRQTDEYSRYCHLSVLSVSSKERD
ncbi:hypothetical protein LX36DRAFT_202153 [Colletotrichum falcatum]|nr:hypothetical protein LX36DRAFT_202153 [Colletotrichum falcatum]